MGSKQVQHVVAVPMPAQGHLNSLMRFCKLLAQQDGFIVTFVDIDLISTRLQEVSAAGPHAADDAASHEPLIRRAHIPIDGLDLSNDFHLSFRALFQAFSSIAPYLHDLILDLNRDGPPVTCLLSDFTVTFPTQDVADQLGIPRIVLFPFCASRLLLSQYVSQGDQVSMEGVREALATAATRREVFCKGLPGLPTLFNVDLPQFRHVEDDSLFIWNLALDAWQVCNARAHSFVINSFEELETSAFTALSKHSNVPTYGVGPWIQPLHKEFATSLWKEDEECMHWLDQQPTSSVLYVSFGSITVVSQPQFEEILNGLLSSEQRFLWAFRPGLVVEDGTCSSFPTYIMSKSHGKGFVVDWAPQVKVLSHPSVGGFLTHCGWNSVIESIAHGVPMLCWPYFADQPLNARCIVDEWKVGLEVEAGKENSFFIERGEIETAITSLMEGLKGKLVRQNVTKLKEACLGCLSKNGSSYKSLKALIGSLM